MCEFKNSLKGGYAHGREGGSGNISLWSWRVGGGFDGDSTFYDHILAASSGTITIARKGGPNGRD